MRLDGTISKLDDREKRISSFQRNRELSVFLLTTQVGGVGLTLTGADRVVICKFHNSFSAFFGGGVVFRN